MASHVKTLGILHIVFGVLGILCGLFVLLFFGGIAAFVGMTDDSEGAFLAMPILGGIGGFVFLVLLVLSLPGLVAGIGLVNFKPWARTLGIVVSALDLLQVPFGTALGIYGLWVLLSKDGERIFERGNAPVQAIRA